MIARPQHVLDVDAARDHRLAEQRKQHRRVRLRQRDAEARCIAVAEDCGIRVERSPEVVREVVGPEEVDKVRRGNLDIVSAVRDKVLVDHVRCDVTERDVMVTVEGGGVAVVVDALAHGVVRKRRTLSSLTASPADFALNRQNGQTTRRSIAAPGTRRGWGARDAFLDLRRDAERRDQVVKVGNAELDKDGQLRRRAAEAGGEARVSVRGEDREVLQQRFRDKTVEHECRQDVEEQQRRDVPVVVLPVKDRLVRLEPIDQRRVHVCAVDMRERVVEKYSSSGSRPGSVVGIRGVIPALDRSRPLSPKCPLSSPWPRSHV